jgi:hypothetical protein
MVGQAIEDVGGRKAEPLELAAEIGADHAVSPKVEWGDVVTLNASLQVEVSISQ